MAWCGALKTSSLLEKDGIAKIKKRFEEKNRCNIKNMHNLLFRAVKN